MSTAQRAAHDAESSEGSFIDTLQSLIVAFVLAMTFRGFVTEGFVIPTGSMAPTLMGRHVRVQSPTTGVEYPVGLSPDQEGIAVSVLADPMMGPAYAGTGSREASRLRARMGDRILVLKTLYPFFMPNRFDVVVFKNPTNPNGDNGNYIKRLIGLPNETVWLVDGDVFTGPADDPDDYAAYRVQRKPEHVQRSVWQPVFDTDFLPPDPAQLDVTFNGIPFMGWQGIEGDHRAMRWEAGEPLTIAWEGSRLRPITDWTSYNQPIRIPVEAVSDIRVAGSIVPDDAGLVTQMELEARDHLFEFTVDTVNDRASIRMRWKVDVHQWTGDVSNAIDALKPGRAMNVEFWHVDQSSAIYINGERVVELNYEWTPIERLKRAYNWEPRTPPDDPFVLADGMPDQPIMRWSFSGTPFSLRRVQIDRDLHYRRGTLKPADQLNQPFITGLAGFATHPENLGILGPDQFMMLGDNSQASLDSRLWARPADIVKAQVDDAPFVVHRRLLLGKAWIVYFPSPIPYREGGKNVVPDFGRLRFIR